MAYYRQPEFYRSFQCTGDKCPSNCCTMWRIDWTKEEIEKLKSAKCSPELHELIENSFEPHKENPDLMVIKITKEHDFYCPLLTENGLCRIHRELGSEYLSHICRTYPRKMRLSNNVITRTCSTSCCEVMKTLCRDANAMNLVNCSIEDDLTSVRVVADSKESIIEHPELKFRNELFDFFYEIISNKKRSLETSLVLGALAAQKLTEQIRLGEHNHIPEIIKALRPQLQAQSVPAFENAKPNYGLSLGFVGELTNTFMKSNILDNLKEDGKFSVEKYEQGRAIYTQFINNNPNFIRNIALNLLFEAEIPYMDNNKSIFDNYCYYISTIAVIKLLFTAMSFSQKTIKEKMFVYISYFIRGMYHSQNLVSPRIFDKLKQNNISTPAKIALLLK